MEGENKNTQPVQETPQATPETQTPPNTEPSIPQDEKVLSILAYASIGFLLPLILKPGNKTCQFHAKQGAAMFIVSFFTLILLAAIPMLGSLLFLGFVALTAIAMFQAFSGKEWKIPVIGDMAMKIDLNALAMTSTIKKEKTDESQQETK
ncbi:MAG: hypothetical protein ACD_65C00077G0003 [uncultured bacterium]|nr:MAG: hypothetical protein ACD_65C00077G0003 [uncultured bacterium]KKT02854.1 MAG: hypothetical protein UV80_C0002G0321 [Candidatus Peregrinibacteria bacterium GW2011_GWF2_43_17]KKT19995.1 MAG: hypothetical protein UW03_C0011G0016 [Candidatus Peregrinibacteria bacterium GW2011_GWA2_43_8]